MGSAYCCSSVKAANEHEQILLKAQVCSVFATDVPTSAWGAGALELQWNYEKRQLLNAAKKKDLKRMRSSQR